MLSMRDEARGGWSHVGRCRSIFRVRGDAPMTPDHTAVQVRRSGKGGAEIGQSPWKGLSTVQHKKAPVRRPCSRLATLHGAPRTRLFMLSRSGSYSVNIVSKIVSMVGWRAAQTENM